MADTILLHRSARVCNTDRCSDKGIQMQHCQHSIKYHLNTNKCDFNILSYWKVLICESATMHASAYQPIKCIFTVYICIKASYNMKGSMQQNNQAEWKRIAETSLFR